MGFLDPNEQVLDVVLTREGRRQLASGRLRFVTFALFDDEIDYDPYISGSGSMDETSLRDTRESLIEDTPVFEPLYGRLVDEVSDADHVLGPAYRLFDMPQGQTVLPHLSLNPDITGSLMEVRQVAVSSKGPAALPMGVLRQRPSVMDLTLDVVDYFPDEMDRGVRVRVLLSGSEGLTEISPMLDYLNEYSFGLHLKIYTDEDDEKVSRKVSRAEGNTEA